MKIKAVIIILLTIFLMQSSFAQKNSEINWLGYIRSTYNYTIVDEGDNTNQFKLMLATLGLSANINEYSSVFMFVYFNYPGMTGIDDSTLTPEFSNVAGILDAQAHFTPIRNFRLTFGQFVTPFATENLQSASKIDFVSRGYVVANSPAYRDIGAYARYKAKRFALYTGVTNGSGMNVADDNNHKNVIVRGEVEPFKMLKLAAAASVGKDNNPVDSLAEGRNYYSANLSFNKGGLYITAEGSVRDYLEEQTNALYAYARYDYFVDGKLLHYITPGFRYDFLDPPGENDKTDRITFGLTLGFDKIKWLSHFRLNYELITGEGDIDPPDNIIAEFQMRFD